MFLAHRVEELAARSLDTRRAIGAFVLRERMNLSKYTIADIAAATHSSKASVTRFAQSLGYSGWRDFIRDYMAEARYEASRETLVDANRPFPPGASADEIAERIADLHYEAVADTVRLLNREMLELGARFIDEAKHVWVFGVSPNSYIGGLFCRKLLAVGKTASVVHNGEYGVVARSLEPVDCAVFISYSGNNPDANPLAQIPELKRRGVPMIGITSEGGSYLRQQLRCVLTVSSHEALYSKIATFATEASMQYLLDALFACAFAHHYDENLSHKLKYSQELEGARKSQVEA